MKIGFVGNGTDKFTKQGYNNACKEIERLGKDASVIVSGHSPVGGIDIWAEEFANYEGIPLDLKIPETKQWNPPGGYGYKARNLDIAKDSDVLYVILADKYPPDYKGMHFKECYHCKSMGRNSTDHVKSGGCWTGKQALKMGKEVHWVIIPN
jgi:hypothetical protein